MFQRLLLKIGNRYSFENVAELLILISFDQNRKKKIISILGRDIPSQIGLFWKERYRWLCLASVYQIIWNTLVKHGFIEKNKSQYF